MSFVPLLVAALVSSSGEDVVARVDGAPITRAAVERRLEVARGLRASLSPDQALESIVNDALLAAEARRLGLGDPREIAALVDREMRVRASAAFVESVATRREADEATLREMFHATSDFVAYDLLAYGTQQEARAARERIDKGGKYEAEAPGALAARLYPKAAEAPLSMRAQLGPMAPPLFAAAPGGIVGPLEDEKGGWIVARVLRTVVGSDAELAARRAELVGSFRQQTLASARAHLLEQLRAKTNAKVDEAFLKGVQGARPTEEQLQHVIATVGGAPLRYADVYPQIAAMGGQGSHMASARVKIELATSLVDDRLIEGFAIERGFDKAPQVVAQRAELERTALAGLALARIHVAVKPPTSREIKRHYEENRARYWRPLDAVRGEVVSQILQKRAADDVEAHLAELRAKASIQIDRAALARQAAN